MSRWPLVVDAWPWYSEPGGYELAVARTLAELGYWVVGRAELERASSDLLEANLQPGDLIVAPLMSGALMASALREARSRGHEVLLLPMSKHPFVTLSADDDTALNEWLRLYEAWGRSHSRAIGRLARHASRSLRIVFADTNTATGRDALLLKKLVEHRVGSPFEFVFLALFNESTEDPAKAAGWRSGPKALIPTDFRWRVVNENVRYLSHLRFLAQEENLQIARARSIRRALPTLTAFWDQLPQELSTLHGHRDSVEMIHVERTHARLTKSDASRRDLVVACMTELDVALPLTVGPRAGQRRSRLLRGDL